jgi:hypothetical protein
MKKIKILLLSLSILATFNVFSASVDFKFTKMKISGSNLVFNVEMASNVGTTYLGGVDLYINYNTAAFGSNIASLITVTPGGLITSAYTVPPPTNTTASRFNVNATNLFGVKSNVLTTYSLIFTISIPIVDANQLAGINFQLSAMGSGQVYYLAPTGGSPNLYTPVTASNNLTSLPLNPNLSLMFSEIADPSNTTTNFVEIYNAGAATVDFTNNYAWYLNFNGSSSVLLTGTLAAGASYTVAFNSTDFTPSLVSALVGSGGNTNYLLTTYGDYTDGTSIDVYTGTTSGFDYTGKHAVRHYNITSPNTTLTAAEWVISPAMAVDMTPGSHHVTLTWGGSSSDWHSRASWTQGFIPDAGHNVSITAGTPTIINGDNGYAHNLAISGSGGLIIDSQQSGGDGSLITYGTVTGNATVKRFLLADRWWYVSQPVTSATANVFLHTWLYTYNEAASGWNTFISVQTTPLVLMKGYADWTSSINPWHGGWVPVGDTTTSYTGILNTGNISIALTKGGDGWNFVGNPYPSAVDWAATTGWTKTNLTTNAYTVWTGATNGTYTVGSGGTNGVTQYIPAAHGFFVNASAAGSLGVSNAVRTHSTQAFYKTEENMLNRLSLTVSDGTVSDETVIYFNEGASNGLDYIYDAPKLMAEAAPQAYTILAGNKMAINTYNNTTETPSVDMGVNAPVEGDYSIIASNIESFDVSTPIYLEDLLTGQKINLRETTSYTFTAAEGTADRFRVHFTEYQGIGDNPASDVNSIYAVNLNVYVDFQGVKGKIAIYNILGQEISHTDATKGLNVMSVPEGNAVYIVKVISDNTTVTKKVFVK